MALSGWVKLHRGLSDHHIASDPNALSVWVHLLMLANHAETKRLINGRVITVMPGQILTSRKSLSAKTGVQESKVERILKMMQNEQQIEQHGTTKFRVISIRNWHEYQSAEQQSEQQVNSGRTASEQQVNTPEEVLEREECKEKSYLPSGDDAKAAKKPRAKSGKTKIPDPFLVTGEMRQWATERVPGVDLKLHTEKFVNYWRAEAKTKADWPATWRNWMLSEQERGGRTGGGYKPINRQQQIEDANQAVVLEIAERERLRRLAEQGKMPQQDDFISTGDIIIEGEYIHAQ